MPSIAKLYIVEGSVLPEVFIKVTEAKSLLEMGEANTVAEAVSRVGLSRSAFYKYKDSIRPFRDIRRDRMLTVSVFMRDEPGALFSVLAIFANSHANILTINQSIPTNGVAIVTMSMMAEETGVPIDDLKTRTEQLSSVIRVEILAG